MNDGHRKALRVIISGGGTGGHIFPALSIADKLMETDKENTILFVGAEGRMEMEKVPAAGYDIAGLPVAGLQRKLTLSNLALPFKIARSLCKADKIIRDFRPDIAVGVGGYASAPLLWRAQARHIPTLIQEQNGFAGLTNKILGKKAESICVAYEGMERFFPEDRIVLAGNPIRSEIGPADAETVRKAVEYYGLKENTGKILIVGGSLGSRTLNNAVMKWISAGCPGGENLEIIWQCGKFYKNETDRFMEEAGRKNNCGVLDRIRHCDFIKRMDYAYAAADLVISRAGASSVSELCAAGKAVILVPSPNVAEDHQTHNAMALVRKKAAVMVTDAEAPEKLMETAVELMKNETLRREMETNIVKMARTDAADRIVGEIYRLVSSHYENNI